MNKGIISVAGLLLISISTISQGKLLSHYEERGVPLPEKLRKSINKSENPDEAYAYAHQGSGKVNTNVEAIGENGFKIYNRSDTTQYIKADRYECLNIESCTHSQETYSINPQTSEVSDTAMNTFSYIDKRGKYENLAAIEVTGYSDYDVTSKNSIYVS